MGNRLADLRIHGGSDINITPSDTINAILIKSKFSGNKYTVPDCVVR